jgi:hypothetical protein
MRLLFIPAAAAAAAAVAVEEGTVLRFRSWFAVEAVPETGTAAEAALAAVAGTAAAPEERSDTAAEGQTER